MFGLPPEIVVFDTEYTSWEGSMERGWSGPGEYREFVEMGAVRLETERFSEFDSFDVCVKPIRNPILSDYFTRLTGITQEELDREGIAFPEALERFRTWCKEEMAYSWGGDAAVLEENCGFAGIAFPFERSRFSDIRDVFAREGIQADWYMSSTIVRAFGIEPSRPGHRAINDARTIADGLRALHARLADAGRSTRSS